MPVTLPRIELSNGQLTFVSPKEEEGHKDDMVFEGKMVGKRLVGTATGPDNTPWFWIGEKAPYANAQQFLVRAQRGVFKSIRSRHLRQLSKVHTARCGLDF